MLFALALTPTPDLELARSLNGLHDLDDNGVRKWLGHQRRQASGSAWPLRPDQYRVGAAAYILEGGEAVHLHSVRVHADNEREVLEDLFDALGDGQCRLLSWNGDWELDLLAHAALRNGIVGRGLWALRDEEEGEHLDLACYLTTDPLDCPPLDELARGMGLPGFVGHAELARGQVQDIQDPHVLARDAELRALNLYLVGLHLEVLRGECDPDQAQARESQLRGNLARRTEEHLTAFLEAW